MITVLWRLLWFLQIGLRGLCHTRASCPVLPLTDPLVSKGAGVFPFCPCPNSQAGTGTEGWGSLWRDSNQPFEGLHLGWEWFGKHLLQVPSAARPLNLKLETQGKNKGASSPQNLNSTYEFLPLTKNQNKHTLPGTSTAKVLLIPFCPDVTYSHCLPSLQSWFKLKEWCLEDFETLSKYL